MNTKYTFIFQWAPIKRTKSVGMSKRVKKDFRTRTRVFFMLRSALSSAKVPPSPPAKAWKRGIGNGVKTFKSINVGRHPRSNDKIHCSKWQLLNLFTVDSLALPYLVDAAPRVPLEIVLLFNPCHFWFCHAHRCQYCFRWWGLPGK